MAKASVSSGATSAGVGEKPKRKLSAAARKRIAVAQKKRWAEYRNKLTK